MPIIGREPPADIVVPAPQVSARHAEIVHLGGEVYQLTDQGSTNGTYVNGQRVQSANVRMTDRISLGSQPFVLSAHAHLIPHATSAYAPHYAPQPWAPPPPVPTPQQPWSQPAPVFEGGGTPWDRREHLGFFPALFQTVRDVIGQPTNFFRSMRVDLSVWAPWLLSLLLLAVETLVTMLSMALLFGGRLGGLPLIGFGRIGLPELAVLLGTALVAAVVWLVGFFIAAGIDHLFLLMFSGGERGFTVTGRVYAYATAGLAVLAMIPVVGMLIGGIYGIVLRIIGYSEVHGVTRGKATAAVLLATFLPAILFVLLIMTVIGGIGLPFRPF